jgi:hypothetical protein
MGEAGDLEIRRGVSASATCILRFRLEMWEWMEIGEWFRRSMMGRKQLKKNFNFCAALSETPSQMSVPPFISTSPLEIWGRQGIWRSSRRFTIRCLHSSIQIGNVGMDGNRGMVPARHDGS